MLLERKISFFLEYQIFKYYKKGNKLGFEMMGIQYLDYIIFVSSNTLYPNI